MRVSSFLLHEYISDGLDMFFSVVRSSFNRSLVATCIRVIRFSFSTKSNSGVTGMAVVFIVANDADCYFGALSQGTHSVEPSLVTVVLQGDLFTIGNFHVSRPSEVARYCPSAIIECKEFAFWLTTINSFC